VGPGVVRNYASLPSLIGEMAGGVSARAERIAALLSGSGLPVGVSADIVRDKWRKLLLNVALSATSGATKLSIGAVMAVPELEATARRAMAETIAVALACGVDLNDSACFDVFDAIVGSNAAANTTSMCRDILARRPSEVDAIYGRTIRLAEQAGVPVPTLRTLAAIIKGIESHYIQPANSQPPPP
jgi:2-dehydropantoate 2-reductase